jgi:alpha-beta hydrolase superfamily lysophospholipase
MSDNWKTLGMQFATEGFEVHLLDLRNHGRSFHAEGIQLCTKKRKGTKTTDNFT